jgi:hypothetical protein
VGSDGKLAAVVTTANDVVALADGKVLWRQKLPAQVYAAPLVAGARVFVLAADRSVTAFDGQTGRRLWTQQRPGEALVLRQAGVILAVGDTLVVGQAGRLVGMNPINGSARWDAPIATPRGTNDIERLVDLVAGVSAAWATPSAFGHSRPMKPVIALVGRPNVGKSTLFNRMTKSRDAIVADFAGLTRDRHYGDGRLGKREFIVIDTGGFEPDGRDRHLHGDGQADAPGGGRGRCGDLRGRRARRAVGAGPRHRRLPAHAGQAVRAGGQQGRRHDRGPQLAEFHELGMGEPHPGVGRARPGHPQPAGAALAPLICPTTTTTRTGRREDAPIRWPWPAGPTWARATLINTWLGEERLVAFDQPGTTRDAITCRSSATARSSS